MGSKQNLNQYTLMTQEKDLFDEDGSYTGPASRAYLYYTDEHKQWVESLKVEIKAR